MVNQLINFLIPLVGLIISVYSEGIIIVLGSCILIFILFLALIQTGIPKNMEIKENVFMRDMFGPIQTKKHNFKPELGFPGANANICCVRDGLGRDPTHLCGRNRQDPIHIKKGS